MTISSGAGWIATLAYTFQLYFDFSGYSDMAVGLSLLFGVRIPVNFLSPYKATSIIEFWRCWHISLSSFLRDYLYIPLGGNRKGPVRRYINLFLTMLLGGLWHGASWNFLIWGGLHGVYLLINHAWRRFVGVSPGPFAGGALTFLAVLIGWVFFSAADLPTAQRILTAMASVSQLGGWSWAADPHLATVNIWRVAALLSVAAAISFLLPNSVQITDRILRAVQNGTARACGWPTRRWLHLDWCSGSASSPGKAPAHFFTFSFNERLHDLAASRFNDAAKLSRDLGCVRVLADRYRRVHQLCSSIPSSISGYRIRRDFRTICSVQHPGIIRNYPFTSIIVGNSFVANLQNGLFDRKEFGKQGRGPKSVVLGFDASRSRLCCRSHLENEADRHRILGRSPGNGY